VHTNSIFNNVLFLRTSGENSGQHMNGLSIVVIFCTIILVLSDGGNVSCTEFSISVAGSLESVRYLHNSIIELFILIVSICILHATYSYNKVIGILSVEYYIIFLLCVCSFCFFVHATNLIFMYVLVELQSISSYILTSFNKRNRYSVEAGLKYFILGSFTSILLVFGFSLLYGFSGVLTLSEISTYVVFVQGNEEDTFLVFLIISFIYFYTCWLFV